MMKIIINAILWLTTLAALLYGSWYFDKADNADTHVFRTELELDQALIDYQNNDIHVFGHGFDSTLGDYPHYLKYDEVVTNSLVRGLNAILILGLIQPVRFVLAVLSFFGTKDPEPIKRLFLVSIEEI